MKNFGFALLGISLGMMLAIRRYEVSGPVDTEEAKRKWYNENAPLGKDLGFPQCCINEFCAQPPQVLKRTKLTAADYARYDASLIDGKQTGFFPCAAHAKQILSGEIKLADLIQNRNSQLPPFPNF